MITTPEGMELVGRATLSFPWGPRLVLFLGNVLLEVSITLYMLPGVVNIS